eukprot:TRINITY_DN9327_c0_g1_i1.p1 TRINITY_DN9327_c0_g1~~TRINITY_DN9327_c0_g1_i1.p1  ORF type:complete len:173 (-),score=56.19 TRINITY_DN9327_c0_g1_i1:139-657(-)
MLHVVWGLSKDFCASGLRVGCLYTRNPSLLRSLGAFLGYFGCVSSLAQGAVAALLGDLDWVRGYVAENHRRLLASHRTLTAALDAHGLPYVRSWASLFLWIDLRGALPAPTFEAERELWQRLVSARVVLVPGETCHADEPGFFRCCFAAVPREALPVLADRIAAVCRGPRTP